MDEASLKKALRRGGRIYGTLITSPSPFWPRRLAGAGLDFVFIDTEHIPIGRETLSWMCLAYAGVGLAPIVRIPSPDPYAACRAIEGGAAGIVAPYIETVSETLALRGAVKLRPLKGQRLEDILSEKAPLDGELKDYLENRARDHILLVNIESCPAIDNLDAILAVPDLDGILIGPHDLSCSLGLPEQYTHPRFTEALRTIITRTREAGLAAGVHFCGCGPMELAVEWINMGINLHIQHSDITYAVDGMKGELLRIRGTLGEESEAGGEGIIV